MNMMPWGCSGMANLTLTLVYPWKWKQKVHSVREPQTSEVTSCSPKVCTSTIILIMTSVSTDVETR